MQKSINQDVKIPTLNGKPLRLQESHQKAGVEKYQFSDYLASMSFLAEGESDNKDSSRNATVVITDLKTGLFKGISGGLREKHFTLCFVPCL